MPTPMPTAALLDAALAYAARGWRVIPLHGVDGSVCTCAKRNDCRTPGKHPPITNWVNEATTDTACITAWWQHYPRANVGIVTGAASGIVVIDTDPRHGGDVNLDELQYMYARLPDTPKVLTGGGGTHDYFACTEILPSCDLAQGIQFQTEGHLVVAPPSLHASGETYTWEMSLDPEDIPLAPLPDWVRALALSYAHDDATLTLPDLAHLPTITMADLKISPRLKYVIETGQDPDNPAKYPSRSEALFAVIQGLIRGSHDDATIAAVILNRQWRISEKPWGQRDARSLHYEHSIRQWVGKEILRARAKHHPSTNGAAPPSGASGGGLPSPAMHEPPLPWSDYTNARALIADHGATLRYCHPWKKWLTWTGSHWNLDDSGTIRQQAKHTIKRLARDVEHLDDDKAKALMAHVKKSLSTASLKAMIENAQDEPGIPVLPDVLDSNPWALNCTNGTIDLTTGTLTPHTPGHLITRCLAVDYNPDAACPTWDSFLDRIMDGNANLKTFLQQAIGYALTGVIREHVLFILWGTGRNGKSTFLNTLRGMLGAYAIKAPSELLMVSNSDRHPTERADLLGKRFVSAIETEQGRKLAEVFVKEATGGDPIRARRMREDFWEFLPTHKVFLATNHKPVVTGTDTAIWERLRLIPFAVTIPNEDRDTALADKLNAELPGILAWAVRGCLAWQAYGLGQPEEVLEATAGYRTEMDMGGQFIAECCLLGPSYRVKASELYDGYRRWCEQNGEHADTQRTWGMALSERGLERFKIHGLSWWRGVTVKPTGWDTAQDNHGNQQAGEVAQEVAQVPLVHQKSEEVDKGVSKQVSQQTDKVAQGCAIPAHEQHIHIHMRDICDFSSTSSTSSTCTESPMMEEKNEENQIVTCKHTYMVMTDGRRCTRCNALD